ANHVHFDVVGVSQSDDDAAVQAAAGGSSPTPSSATTPPDSSQCGCSSSAPLSGTGNDEKSYNYFTGTKGLSPAAAAGIVGNLAYESTGTNPEDPEGGFYGYTEGMNVPSQNLSDAAINDSSFGWGIAQFTPPSKYITSERQKGKS